MAENQSKDTPARVLLLFTLLFAGVTAAAWREAGHRDSIESVDFPTALADAQYCPISLLTKGAAFQGMLDGHEKIVTFTVAASSARKQQEERLWKVGKTADGAFYIYQQQGGESKSLWVKSAPNQFYEVTVDEASSR
jgi:hypothetical protein